MNRFTLLYRHIALRKSDRRPAKGPNGIVFALRGIQAPDKMWINHDASEPPVEDDAEDAEPSLGKFIPAGTESPFRSLDFRNVGPTRSRRAALHFLRGIFFHAKTDKVLLMEALFRRSKFKELRFQYYTAGRMLWFNDSMETGALLLGYAVESHLKHALSELKTDAPKDLLFKHEFLRMYRYCVENEIFVTVNASDDLLHFIEDHFHQRYPLQAVEASKRASNRGHAVGLSLDLITIFDAFVIALDDWLWRRLADVSTSIGVMASHFVNRIQGRCFYHCNCSALQKLPEYLQVIEEEYHDSESKQLAEGKTHETIEYNLANQRARLKTLRAGANELWNYRALSTRFHLPDLKDWKVDLSSFRYPGRSWQF